MLKEIRDWILGRKQLVLVPIPVPVKNDILWRS